jgi:hypothetical protein
LLQSITENTDSTIHRIDDLEAHLNVVYQKVQLNIVSQELLNLASSDE